MRKANLVRVERKEKLKSALTTIKELAPKMYNILREGFHVLVCEQKTDIEQIESVVKMYLYAKNIDLAPRVTELLIWFVKYDTSTKSRKIISRQISMTGGTINQNASKLKKAGLILYPYEDSKKSVVEPALIKLRDYILDPKKGNNVLVRFDEKGS